MMPHSKKVVCSYPLDGWGLSMWSFHALSVPVQVQDRQKTSFSIISSLCVKLSYSGVDGSLIFTIQTWTWYGSLHLTAKTGKKTPKQKKGILLFILFHALNVHAENPFIPVLHVETMSHIVIHFNWTIVNTWLSLEACGRKRDVLIDSVEDDYQSLICQSST